jgi:hypothetical protein
MVTKAQKNSMKDFLVSSLELAHSGQVVPQTRKIIGNEKSELIFVGNDGVVLLVDRPYVNDSFSRIHRFLKAQKASVAPVFFKDGETFFRNAAERHYFKSSDGLSLKTYDAEDMRRMILCRPEEIFMLEKSDWLQYYQPASQRLPEAVISARFDPVVFDYSHISARERYKPEDKASERLNIVRQRINLPRELHLSQNMLSD